MTGSMRTLIDKLEDEPEPCGYFPNTHTHAHTHTHTHTHRQVVEQVESYDTILGNFVARWGSFDGIWGSFDAKWGSFDRYNIGLFQ